MTKLVNRAKMTTATTGTGTIALGSAVDGYQTFADAGVSDADVVRYVIEDGKNWEIGLGTYSAGALTRGSIESSNADAALNLSGNSVVYVSAAAADLQELVDFADNFVLPTADGSTGQVLTTNGAGTLSFSTISGYTNADVDAHLNTSTATTGEVLSWNGSDYDWVAVAAGATNINGLSDGYSVGESVGLGSGALANDDGTTNRNTAVGYQTGYYLTTGANNFLGGYRAGYYLTTGSNNVAIGNGALDAATTGGRNIAIGQDAMGFGVATANPGGNVGIGYQTGYDLSTGANNFLGGYLAGANITTGSNNVAIGNGALDAATTGGTNVAIGQNAMGAGVATAASGNNVGIGVTALNAITSGTNNTAVGNTAGSTLTTGGNNTLLGNGADASSATVSNEITLGNSSITTLRCQVTTITSLSDARDKTDIQPLNAGLEFVEALNPVSFTWNMRDGGKVGVADTGFIAQDLQKAQADTGVSIPGLVYDVNPDKLEVGYGKLIPVLVQAIKDLSDKVKDLEAKLEAKA